MTIDDAIEWCQICCFTSFNAFCVRVCVLWLLFDSCCYWCPICFVLHVSFSETARTRSLPPNGRENGSRICDTFLLLLIRPHRQTNTDSNCWGIYRAFHTCSNSLHSVYACIRIEPLSNAREQKSSNCLMSVHMHNNSNYTVCFYGCLHGTIEIGLFW